ncbi:hypothetical protein HMI55_007355 [Coelomomyces lativittatus]|nr:hypothetical protein HMI55_007355 [Coelomomyces lativittatus]
MVEDEGDVGVIGDFGKTKLAAYDVNAEMGAMGVDNALLIFRGKRELRFGGEMGSFVVGVVGIFGGRAVEEVVLTSAPESSKGETGFVDFDWVG